MHNFQTVKEGWTLVHHHVGNILLVARLALESDEGARGDEEIKKAIKTEKERLVSILKQISGRMIWFISIDDGRKIQELLEVVQRSDFVTLDAVEEIHRKLLELDPEAQALRDEVNKIFGREK